MTKMTERVNGNAKRTRTWQWIAVTCAVLLVGSGVAVGAVDYPGWYSIVSLQSTKCVEVQSWKTSNGDNIVQYGYHGGANQLWRIESVGEDVYVIYNRHSGLCLEVAGWEDGARCDQDQGANVRQWEYVGGSNQQWKVEWLEEPYGYYRVINVGSGKALDVSGRSNANGANLHQWSWHGGHNQVWEIRLVHDVADANEAGVSDGIDFEAADVDLSGGRFIGTIEFRGDYNLQSFDWCFIHDGTVGAISHVIHCSGSSFEVYSYTSSVVYKKLMYSGTPSINGNTYRIEFPASALELNASTEFTTWYWFRVGGGDRMPDSGLRLFAHIM